MRCLVFNAIAIKEGYDTSPQLSRTHKSDVAATYLKNAFVSLTSAKIKNPDIDACLFVNFEVCDIFKSDFVEQGIEIKQIEFNNFLFPPSYIWALAYFKINALKYAIDNTTYDKYMLLDTDTYTISSYNDIWSECNNGILLFNVDHRLSHPHRNVIIDNMELVLGQGEKITHYGGEFIAGSHKLLTVFLSECLTIFGKMKNLELDRTLGDEFVISVAAHKIRKDLVSANCYIYRYWTNPTFYFVATNYINNSVDIWHLPAEKERGMLGLYNYFRKNKNFPNVRRSAKMLRLPSATPFLSYNIRRLIYRINLKLGSALDK